MRSRVWFFLVLTLILSLGWVALTAHNEIRAQVARTRTQQWHSGAATLNSTLIDLRVRARKWRNNSPSRVKILKLKLLGPEVPEDACQVLARRETEFRQFKGAPPKVPCRDRVALELTAFSHYVFRWRVWSAASGVATAIVFAPAMFVKLWRWLPRLLRLKSVIAWLVVSAVLAFCESRLGLNLLWFMLAEATLSIAALGFSKNEEEIS